MKYYYWKQPSKDFSFIYLFFPKSNITLQLDKCAVDLEKIRTRNTTYTS